MLVQMGFTADSYVMQQDMTVTSAFTKLIYNYVILLIMLNRQYLYYYKSTILKFEKTKQTQLAQRETERKRKYHPKNAVPQEINEFGLNFLYFLQEVESWKISCRFGV